MNNGRSDTRIRLAMSAVESNLPVSSISTRQMSSLPSEARGGLGRCVSSCGLMGSAADWEGLEGRMDGLHLATLQTHFTTQSTEVCYLK